METEQKPTEMHQHTIWQDGKKPEPCVIVVFGATGDLAHKKILPTLAHLVKDHPVPEGFSILAYARRPMDDEQWRQDVTQSITQYMSADDKPDADFLQKFAQRLFYCQGNFDDPNGYLKLGAELDKLDKERGTKCNRLFYLATPPGLDSTIIEQLGKANLVHPVMADGTQRPWSRIIIEKPFGHDLASAQELNQILSKVFRESQIFRIDHYMGKETVQNLMAFRFANRIFEPLWNQRYIDHIQILMAEDIGIGTRAEFYDQAGAIRDIVQNHIMQILTLISLEPPVSFDADDIRNEKVKVLKAVPHLTQEEVRHRTVRGQYVSNVVNGEKLNGYKEEQGIPTDSTTETFVALKLYVDNWRWAGVPIYVRTGKRLPKRNTEVFVQFKKVPHQLYKPSDVKGMEQNSLTIRIQPDEGMDLRFGAKVPGAARHLKTVDMNFYYNEFGVLSPDAYERLIADCMLGDSTLFIRRDEIEAAWGIIDSVTKAWKNMDASSVHPYPAGSWGPEEANALIEKDGRHWANP